MDRVAGRPYTMSPEEMDQYQTIGALIDGTTSREFRTSYSWDHPQRVVQPYSYAKDFCAHQGGDLVRTLKLPGPTINPRYRPDSDYTRKQEPEFQAIMASSFGEFECQVMGFAPMWAIKTSASNIEYLNWDGQYGPRVSNAGKATISIVTYDTAESLMKYRVQQRELQDAEEKRAAEQRARAEEEGRRRQEERMVAEEAAREHRLSAQQAMLSSLKLGTETHCGMVIDIRENLVEVQTEVVGNRWFKRGELFAPGDVQCKFLNGEYQNPF